MFSLSIIDVDAKKYIDYDDQLKKYIKIEATQH